VILNFGLLKVVLLYAALALHGISGRNKVMTKLTTLIFPVGEIWQKMSLSRLLEV
jgi:hypothetical protein